jgi:predicted MFS family arabinose efflux permease
MRARSAAWACRPRKSAPSTAPPAPIAFLVGSILGGYFTSWIGLKRAMPVLILAMNVPNLVFYYLSMVQPESLGLVTAALAPRCSATASASSA